MTPHTLTLPWPPSGNNLWRHIPQRRKPVLSREGKAYFVTVASLVAKARALEAFPPRPLAGRLLVTLEFCPADRRKRDSGNMEKTLYDALTRARVWGDDAQGNDKSVAWRDPDGAPRVVVTFESLKDMPAIATEPARKSICGGKGRHGVVEVACVDPGTVSV